MNVSPESRIIHTVSAPEPTELEQVVKRCTLGLYAIFALCFLVWLVAS